MLLVMAIVASLWSLLLVVVMLLFAVIIAYCGHCLLRSLLATTSHDEMQHQIEGMGRETKQQCK